MTQDNIYLLMDYFASTKYISQEKSQDIIILLYYQIIIKGFLIHWKNYHIYHHYMEGFSLC